MSWRQDTMVTPPIEELLGRVDSKFTLVTLAAKRARQVNSYFNQLGEGLGSLIPPQVASTARKPLSISFEEIAADKITFVRTEVVDPELLAAQAASAEEAELGPVGSLTPMLDESAGGELGGDEG